MTEDNTETRREVLRKVAAFTIPTLITFQTSALTVAASGGPEHKTGKIGVTVEFPD